MPINPASVKAIRTGQWIARTEGLVPEVPCVLLVPDDNKRASNGLAVTYLHSQKAMDSAMRRHSSWSHWYPLPHLPSEPKITGRTDMAFACGFGGGLRTKPRKTSLDTP